VEPLNLIHLAKADLGALKAVPQTELHVQALHTPTPLEPGAGRWLLVLEGGLIVDLPHGDFRVLKVGDSIRLGGAEQATLTPLETAVVLSLTV
jgi:hypothetical protein